MLHFIFPLSIISTVIWGAGTCTSHLDFSTSPIPPAPLPISGVCMFPIICLLCFLFKLLVFSTSHVRKTVNYPTTCVWFISLKLWSQDIPTFLKMTQIVLCECIVLNYVYMHPIFIMHWSTDWHIGHFYNLAVMSFASTNMRMCESL